MSLYGQGQSSKDTSLEDEGLFEYVARHNGPLDDYHPQMTLQCLLWGKLSIYSVTHSLTDFALLEKVELVKKSFINLSRNLARTRDVHRWTPLPFEEFLKKDDVAKAVSGTQTIIKPITQHVLESYSS